jgi:hypothetical protein
MKSSEITYCTEDDLSVPGAHLIAMWTKPYLARIGMLYPSMFLAPELILRLG